MWTSRVFAMFIVFIFILFIIFGDGWKGFYSIFFDRLIAAFSMKGNVGFLIYVADAVGYVGSVSVLLVKEGMSLQIKWTQFFSESVMILSLVGVFITLYAMYYFYNKQKGSIPASPSKMSF